jgi:hypothetical protein
MHPPYNLPTMAKGGRDAGFWILVVIATVTVVCAAYTLLSVTGAFGDSATQTSADSKQSEITVETTTASTRSPSTPDAPLRSHRGQLSRRRGHPVSPPRVW